MVESRAAAVFMDTAVDHWVLLKAGNFLIRLPVINTWRTLICSVNYIVSCWYYTLFTLWSSYDCIITVADQLGKTGISADNVGKEPFTTFQILIYTSFLLILQPYLMLYNNCSWNSIIKWSKNQSVYKRELFFNAIELKYICWLI
jgi:hypothetical protein